MTEEADALQLGWLGTGRMGAAMVRRLLAHGCDVTVYNRTAVKAVPLVELGATADGDGGSGDPGAGLAVSAVPF